MHARGAGCIAVVWQARLSLTRSAHIKTSSATYFQTAELKETIRDLFYLYTLVLLLKIALTIDES